MRRRRSPWLLAVLALGLADAPAAAQPQPFEGRWATQPAWCGAAARPPDQPPPIVLTQRKLSSTVLTCDFTSVLPGGSLYRVEADCIVTATKERGQEFFGFTRFGNLLHWSWGDRTITLHRCPNQ